MQTIDELEKFMFKHGENIVDMLGGEIDRIELKLRVSFFLKNSNSWLDFTSLKISLRIWEH